MSEETKVYEITVKYSCYNRDLGSLVDNQLKIYERFQRDLQARLVQDLPVKSGSLEANLIKIVEK